MKLLDKVKNMFTEEVEETPKQEVKIEQIMPEPRKEFKALEDFNQLKETEIKKEEKKPIFFTDDDFNDLDSYFKKEELPKREEVKEKTKEESKKLYATEYNPTRSANDYLEQFNKENNKEKEPYQGNTNEKKTTKFKPTPIISPVYGILDKNYHKEDIVTKKETSYKSIDGLSVDSIRDKAYGTLEDELENTLFGSNSILFNKKEEANSKENKDFFADLEDESNSDDSLRDLENITMDIGKELDTLLSKDNSYKNDSKNTFDDDDDLFNLIDTMYEGDDYDD